MIVEVVRVRDNSALSAMVTLLTVYKRSWIGDGGIGPSRHEQQSPKDLC